MKSSSTTISILEEARMRVRSMTEARNNLETRVQALEVQKSSLEAQLPELTNRRGEIIAGIAGGTHTDNDLMKVKKDLSKCQDSLQDAGEILLVTREALKGAERDLVQAQKDLSNAERKEWRRVIEELKARHQAELEKVFLRMYIAGREADAGFGGTLFTTTQAMFDLQCPREDLPDGQAELRRIKEDLMAEFGL